MDNAKEFGERHCYYTNVELAKPGISDILIGLQQDRWFMSSLSIAVVEDDSITLDMITAALETRLGATVFAFDNSKAARDFLLQQTDDSIDLVISDQQMPDFDGLTLLKTCNASLLNVPFLLVTAEASRDMVISAKKLGASGFLAKPVDMAELADKVLEVTA